MSKHTVWARNKDFPRHVFSIDGDILRLDGYDSAGKMSRQKLLSQSINAHGYPQVGLGIKKVANLVAQAFLYKDKTNYKCQVLHKNDIKSDSRLENLYYGSYEDNLADAVRNGNRVYKVHENCDKSKWKPLRVHGRGIDKVFPSIKEACIFIGVGAAAVSQALKKQSKTGGYNVELQAK